MRDREPFSKLTSYLLVGLGFSILTALAAIPAFFWYLILR